MHHSIVNQYGKYIIDTYIVDEIKDAIDKDKTHCYINSTRIDIELDVKCEQRRVTKVIVEGL